MTAYPPFSLLSFWQLQEVFQIFDNANCPSLQNKPKMFFIQACRGGECPGRAAPGWWLLTSLPPALTLLFAPLRCYWIPWAPPSVHCCHRLSCSVSVSQCMGCAGTWAATALRLISCVHHHVLFSRLFVSVSALFAEDADVSVLIHNPDALCCYSFQFRVFCLSLLPVPVPLAFIPFFFSFLHLSSPFPLSPFSSLFTQPAILASVLLFFIIRAPCRTAVRKPRSALTLPLHPSSASIPFFLACSLRSPFQIQDSMTRRRRHAGMLIREQSNNNEKF